MAQTPTFRVVFTREQNGYAPASHVTTRRPVPGPGRSGKSPAPAAPRSQRSGTENAPPGLRAWYGMFPQLGAPLGFFFSGGVFLLLSEFLSDEQFFAFGCLIGLYSTRETKDDVL